MKFIFSFALCLLIYFSAVLPTYASHMMGADLSYECLGTNQYRISLNIYRDCSGIAVNNTFSVTLSSASCGQVLNLNLPQIAATGIEVSQLCAAQINQSTCNGGTLPGVQQYTYQGIITLPAQCSDWIVATTDAAMCCRNPTITNLLAPDIEDLHVRALINNSNGLCNNSPFFTSLPVPFVCSGQLINYNHGTVDVDGDSLVYTSVNPLTTAGATIPYQAGFNPNNPLNTSTGFQFANTTGQMTFTPAGIQVAVVAVLVQEFRNGILIGSVMRDIQVVVLNCNNNSPAAPSVPQNVLGGTLVNGVIQVCPGENVNFQFTATDPNPNDIITVTDNASVSIPAASVTYAGGLGNSVIGTFNWTPTGNDVGLNSFTISVEDNACPTVGLTTISYLIQVLQGTTTGPDTAFCAAAGPMQLNVVGGSQFTWTPTAGLSCTNCSNPLASPTTTTTYIVQSNLSSQCKNRDTITIAVVPNFSIEVGNNATICLNAIHPITPIIDSSGAPYTFNWSPLGGLSNANILNPVASPSVTTTYVLTTTSNQGCTLLDSLTVSISGVAPSITAFASPDTVCPGGNTALSFSNFPRNCGLASSPCINGNTPFTLGTGTGTTTDGTPYDGFWHDGRVQYLFRANELTALGLSAGTINSLAWNVINKGSSIPYNNFNIKIGCTNLAALGSTYVPNLTTVLSLPSYTTIAGWNTHTLNTGYDWDGVSNLIIEVCYDNASFTSADGVAFTATAFNSVLFRNVDGASGCTLTGPLIDTRRPNIRFGLCIPTLNNPIITWSSPNTAIIPNPNLPQATAQLFGTTTFIVNVEDGACAGQGFVTVIVDTTVTLDAGPDTSLCNIVPIQLFANATGTPGPIALNCGTNGRTCSGANAITYTLGNSGGINSITSPFKAQEEVGRLQFLVRASELNTIGFTAGIIRSLQFNIASKNSTVSFNQFTIRMGCTGQTTIPTTFTSGLAEVFSPKTITTITGWNSFAFDNTYDWDGFSNLIFEICFTNSGNNNSDIISYTQTPFNSVLFDAQSFVFMNGCDINFTPTLSSFRPDIRILACTPPPGQFSYLWSPSIGLSNPNISNPISTTTNSLVYSVTVTDGTCFATDTVSINFFTSFLTNVTGSNVGCNGNNDGNLISAPSGAAPPYDFNWSSGQFTQNQITDTVFNLMPGTYFLTVTDANGCTQIDSFTLSVPPPLSITLNPSDVTCFGLNDGSISTIVNGGSPGYSFLWSNSATSNSINNISSGVYSVTVTDQSGCLDSAAAQIIEPNEIIFQTSFTDVSCFSGNNGTATLNIISGGVAPFNITWNGDTPINTNFNTLTNLQAGYALFEITDANNCTIIDSILISERDSFIISTQLIQGASCFNTADGIAWANVLGDTINFTFNWLTMPGSTNALAGERPQGVNVVEVTDTLGCAQTAIIVVGSPPQIQLLSDSSNPTCFDAQNGSVSVRVTNGGIAPFTYDWNNGFSSDSVLQNLQAGVFIVEVTDANGCFEWDTVILTNPDSFVVNTAIADVSCFGNMDGSITATASGGTGIINFSWLDSLGIIIGGQNNSALNNLSVGVYQLVISDAQGCTDTIFDLNVNAPNPITVNLSVSDEICKGANDGAVFINVNGGTPPFIFNINNINTLSSTTSSLAPGIYPFNLIDSNNCTVDTSFVIAAAPDFSLDFEPDSFQIRLGDEIVLNPILFPIDTNNTTFIWQPSSDLSCADCFSPIASPKLNTIYELSVINSAGCVISNEVFVGVDNNLIVFVPNAFTPNGDGVNDILRVFGISIKRINFGVFNRWGEKVFEVDTEDIESGWDGKYKGKDLPNGVFVYYLEAEFEDGQQKILKGSIILVR